MSEPIPIKVTYKFETKKLNIKIESYAQFFAYCQKIFDNNLDNHKFFYIDEDNDLISISGEEDLFEALEQLS